MGEGQSLATNFLVSMQVYLANEQAPLLNVCVCVYMCLCVSVSSCMHASANPEGHLKYLNAQNNKLAIFQTKLCQKPFSIFPFAKLFRISFYHVGDFKSYKHVENICIYILYVYVFDTGSADPYKFLVELQDKCSHVNFVS